MPKSGPGPNARVVDDESLGFKIHTAVKRDQRYALAVAQIRALAVPPGLLAL